MARKFSALSVTKYSMAFMVLATLAYTQMKEMILGKEFWNLVTTMITAIFSGYVVKSIKNRATNLGQAIMGCTIVALLCILTILEKPVAHFLWAAVATITTFVFVSSRESME